MENKTIVYIIAVVAALSIGGVLIAIKYMPDLSNVENVVDTSDYVVAHDQIAAVPLQELSEEEKNGLIAMREEEKLAHDVYMALYKKWGINIFRNIAGSEATHTDAVRYLLERYEIDDPVKTQETGVFTNADFAVLYADLAKKGESSLREALIVGATIEDLDIKDLQELIAKTDNEDIKIVYENLMRGSRNHLRSFSKQLARDGIEYTAQYLSQNEIDQIINGNQEKGW